MQAGLIMTRELQPPPVGPGRAGKHRTQEKTQVHEWESRREPDQDSRYTQKSRFSGRIPRARVSLQNSSKQSFFATGAIRGRLK